MEIIEKGVLGMFYPKILMREFYIRNEKDVHIGKTIVRYKNGTCRCVITEKEDGIYVLWDGSGTSGAIRRMTFEELKNVCVVVKYLNKEKDYVGKNITNIEELEADYKAIDNGYDYHEVHKYIRQKETGEIRRFTCRKIADSVRRPTPTGELEFIYTDSSYVDGIDPICSYVTHTMENEDIIKNWEMIEPDFIDVGYEKK